MVPQEGIEVVEDMLLIHWFHREEQHITDSMVVEIKFL